MRLTKEDATTAAKHDLADRLGVDKATVKELSVSEKEFPDMSLGAPAEGEMSAQMISSGWEINLAAGGKKYEYRADKYQLRLRNYKGVNHVIKS